MATFVQTQRRRLRGYLRQAWAKMGIEASAEAAESPHGRKFCSKCRRISAKLEELLHRGFDGPDELNPYHGARRVTHRGDLDHVVGLSQRKRCSLCNFLAHMVEAHHVSQDYGCATSGLSLFIGSAKGRYGIRQDVSQVSDSFLLWIWPTERQDDFYDPLLPYNPDKMYGSAGMALELSDDPVKISGHFVGPEVDFELVRSWFDDCTMRHGTTCQTDASILQDIPGLRVIDCSSRRLVHWSQLPTNEDRNYVALSYVWGTEPDDGNEDGTADWRLPSKLPPLIGDVITAVIKLRFRYLWIDRYCIPQGDQEAKHTQIRNMDSIYGSASLTIIAAAGNDPSDGLPGVSLPRYGRVPANENLSASVRIGSRTFVTVGTADAPVALKHSKWNSRAWTMQEAFLSCRCLVFLRDGAYFQCSSPRSHRFEAIHEPSALLQLKHEVLSTEEHSSTVLPCSLILTKVGIDGGLKLHWCLQLVEDYFLRSMTFEDDTLNAFSGILKYLKSLKPSVHNLWGVLMLPDFISTSSGQRIRYNLVRGLAWSYKRGLFDQKGFGKLEQPTILPRKEIFPSWTWAGWRPRAGLNYGDYPSRHYLEFPGQYSDFICLVNLSLELDDGKIVSWGKGYESDISWLSTSSKPPRVLHIHGYTSNPQLRYITEEEWGYLCDRTFVLAEQVEDRHPNSCKPDGHHLRCDSLTARMWVLIDADGEHLQQPFVTSELVKPWCWYSQSDSDLSIDAYYLQLQRESRTVADDDTFHSSTFNFRVILLGYDTWDVYYMVLMKLPGTDSHTETFERVNVYQQPWPTEPPTQSTVEEFLAKLEGKHTKSCPGTPWVKMSTRIA